MPTQYPYPEQGWSSELNDRQKQRLAMMPEDEFGKIPKGGPPRRQGGGGGFRQLEDVRHKTEQEQIKKTLPKPRDFMEDLHFRAEKLSREELIRGDPSDVLWAKSRDYAKENNISFSRAFKLLGDKVLGNKGESPITGDELTNVTLDAARYGIK